MGKAALWYARHGWRVFPVWPMRAGVCGCGDEGCDKPGKHPLAALVPRGFKDASRDARLIQSWWARFPDANIATPDFLRIDVDTRDDGPEHWLDLIHQHGGADTVECHTPSGGRHYYFKAPAGWAGGNSAAGLPSGIDVRGPGSGYTLLPPSNHVKGRYVWEASSGPNQITVADAPAWLLALLDKSRSRDSVARFGKSPAPARDLTNRATPSVIPEGQRNTTLMSMAGSMRQRGLEAAEMLPSLLALNERCAPPLPESEVAAIAASAARYEPAAAPAGNGHGGEPPAPLRPRPLADVQAQELRPLEFLVEDLFARGHLVILGGRPKSGKSWLLLQLARALDTGTEFLGRKTTQVRVLMVVLEDGERRIQQRCQVLGWQAQQARIVFDIGAFDGDGLLLGEGLVQLWEACAGYDVIIVDTLIAALSVNADENSNTKMGGIAKELSRMAHETYTLIFLSHHAGKDEKDDPFKTLRGASALRGGYDLGLILERKVGEREAILHVESRDFDGFTLTIRQVENGGGWEYVGDQYAIRQIRAGKRVVEAMREHGDGLTAEEVAELIERSYTATHKQLLNAEKHGYVYRIQADGEAGMKPKDLWYLAGGAKA